MLLDNIGVGIADGNNGVLLNMVELLVSGNEFDAAELVSDNAFGNAVHSSAVVSLALTDDFDRGNSEVHVDSCAGLKLVHLNKHRLAESRLGSSLLLCSFDHYSRNLI